MKKAYCVKNCKSSYKKDSIYPYIDRFENWKQKIICVLDPEDFELHLTDFYSFKPEIFDKYFMDYERYVRMEKLKKLGIK